MVGKRDKVGERDIQRHREMLRDVVGKRDMERDMEFV